MMTNDENTIRVSGFTHWMGYWIIKDCIKATTGDPTGISSTSLTMMIHCRKYLYCAIKNPFVCSRVAPCVCQRGKGHVLLNV